MWAWQTGGPGAEGTKMNIMLAPGTDWATYSGHLRKVLDAVAAFGAQVRLPCAAAWLAPCCAH